MASFTLHIQYVDRPAETRTFTQPRLTIGRESGDIILRDSQVSGEHAEILFTDTGLQYVDVGSTNGSFTPDGRRIAKLNLTTGASVRAGNSMLTVRDIQLDRGGRKGGTLIAPPGSIPGMLGRPGSVPPPGAAPPQRTPVSSAAVPTPAQPDPFAATSFVPQVDPGQLNPEATGTDGAPTTEPATPSAGEQLQQGVSQIGQELANAAAAQGITGDDLKASLKDAWTLVAPVLVSASLMVAAIEVPATLAALVLGWIPAVGTILAGLINLAASIAMILVGVAVTRFLLNQRLGQPSQWLPTLKYELTGERAKAVLPSMIVAGLIAGVASIFLIVPGILVGCFISVIFLLEDKKMVDINGRNFELVKHEMVPLIVRYLVLLVGAGIGIGLLVFIVGFIDGLIGLTSAPLTRLTTAILISVFMPYAVSFSITQYLRLRGKYEGGLPEAEMRQRLAFAAPQAEAPAQNLPPAGGAAPPPAAS